MSKKCMLCGAEGGTPFYVDPAVQALVATMDDIALREKAMVVEAASADGYAACRRDVVAWLRATRPELPPDARDALLAGADTIEQGAHVGASKEGT